MVPPQIHFKKTSSIYVAFPHHYTARRYFYYKTISCLFQKWFLLKMYLLFLDIITMRLHVLKLLSKLSTSTYPSTRTISVSAFWISPISKLNASYIWSSLICLPSPNSSIPYRYCLRFSKTHLYAFAYISNSLIIFLLHSL